VGTDLPCPEPPGEKQGTEQIFLVFLPAADQKYIEGSLE
jgi:hypothetical protein